MASTDARCVRTVFNKKATKLQIHILQVYGPLHNLIRLCGRVLLHERALKSLSLAERHETTIVQRCWNGKLPDIVVLDQEKLLYIVQERHVQKPPTTSCSSYMCKCAGKCIPLMEMCISGTTPEEDIVFSFPVPLHALRSAQAPWLTFKFIAFYIDDVVFGHAGGTFQLCQIVCRLQYQQFRIPCYRISSWGRTPGQVSVDHHSTRPLKLSQSQLWRFYLL
jgi:hypothetical protein